MGEAADDLFDHLMQREADFLLFADSVRADCEQVVLGRKLCKFIANPNDSEAEDWLPIMCSHCGRTFDYF